MRRILSAIALATTASSLEAAFERTTFRCEGVLQEFVVSADEIPVGEFFIEITEDGAQLTGVSGFATFYVGTSFQTGLALKAQTFQYLGGFLNRYSGRLELHHRGKPTTAPFISLKAICKPAKPLF